MKMINEKKVGKTFQILQPFLVFRRDDHGAEGIKRRRRLDAAAGWMGAPLGSAKGE
jgi:hypothetical protein